MKNPWFKPYGWIYRPTSWQGWFVTVPAALFCAHILLFVFTRAHSVTDALYAAFPFVIPTFLLWNWIAAKKSS